MTSTPDTAAAVLSQLDHDSPLLQRRREHDRWCERVEQRNVVYTGNDFNILLVALLVRCRARSHHGAACYLLFPQVERLLRSLLTPADRIAAPKNRKLAIPSSAIMRTTMGAVIERLRSMYHAQPAAMRLIALAAAITPIRDLCAHGIVALVDPAVSTSARELSDALYLVMLLVETWAVVAVRRWRPCWCSTTRPCRNSWRACLGSCNDRHPQHHLPTFRRPPDRRLPALHKRQHRLVELDSPSSRSSASVRR